MNPPEVTLSFVQGILDRLRQVQLTTWLSGGWAEELWGLSRPRPHQDVDVLYPASSFVQLDQWLACPSDLTAIAAKQFSHKRAFLCQDILIEVILLEPDEKGGYLTNFFNGRYQLGWPHDPLRILRVGNYTVPVASEAALCLYRQQHHLVVEAYQAYLQQQE